MPVINKKSDWTMDMPKIDYQPDSDLEDDDKSDNVGGGLEQIGENEFLSDDSDEALQNNTLTKPTPN